VTLFPLPPSADAEPDGYSEMSPAARLTVRQRRAIAAGRHPFGGPLRDPPGETCRTCARREPGGGGNRSYWKCPAGGYSHGAASDVRLWWPACPGWSAG
jgi:hypothetical protein